MNVEYKLAKSQAKEIVKIIRKQNWKNGGVLEVDTGAAELLVQSYLDSAYRNGIKECRGVKDGNLIGDVVGNIIAETEAIDHTKVLYLMLTEPCGSGRTLRIDRGDLRVTVEDIANNA
jgi:hypothetical protein